MARTFVLRLPAFAAFAVLSVGSTVVSAQTLPQLPDQGGASVREILGRAEAESRRRTVGDVLGGIAGISRAEAQTAPSAPASGGPVAANGGRPAPPNPIAIAQGAPAAQSPVSITTAQANVGSRPAAPVASPSASSAGGAGTPADPTMIVTVPENSPTPSSAGAPVAANGRTEGAAVVTSAPDSAPTNVAPTASAPVVAAGRAPVVVAEGGSRHTVLQSHRSYGHVSGRDWCPPGRW